MAYEDVYNDWKADPDGFWMEQAKQIDWVTPPTKALFDDAAPMYEWFKDAEVNTCYNAVDRHVEQGNGDRVAIIYDSPITGKTAKITYAELQTQVATCQWSPKPWSRCWPVLGLARSIRLYLVGLPPTNLQFGSMTRHPKPSLQPPVVWNRAEPLNTNHC
jgi:hypothetical protein